MDKKHRRALGLYESQSKLAKKFVTISIESQLAVAVNKFTELADFLIRQLRLLPLCLFHFELSFFADATIIRLGPFSAGSLRSANF
jgi:hypothetical protein